MPYTKTPEYSTHQIKRVPFISSEAVSSDLANNQINYSNCYPRTDTNWASDPRRYLQTVPILRDETPTTQTASGFQGMFVSTTNDRYTVDGGNLYTGSSSTDTVNGSSSKIYFTEYEFADTHYVLVTEHTSGSNTYLHIIDVNTDPTTFASSNDLGFEGTGAAVVMDGYVFIINSELNAIANSNVGDPTTWTIATDYVPAEQYPDTLVTLAVHNNHVVGFSKESIEYFYNAALEIGSPLQRQTQYAQRIGVRDSHSGTSIYRTDIVSVNNMLFFFGFATGSPIPQLYVIDNFQVQALSNNWLSHYVAKQVSSTQMQSMKLVPLDFYGDLILYVPHLGLAYTVKEKAWFFLSYTDDGDTLQPMYMFPISGSGHSVIMYNATDTTLDIRELWATATAGVSMTVSMTTPLLDFGVTSLKHVKWIDLLASFDPDGTASVEAFYNKEKPYATYTSLGTRAVTTVGEENILRWRNAGRFRNMSFKFSFTTTNAAQLEGVDVAYNVGSAV